MGFARITHPYHPFRDQTFKILKSRHVAGRETFILEGTYRGSFAVLREWTDRAEIDPTLPSPMFLSVRHLLMLTDVIASLAKPSSKKRN